ncbi:MAG TPA: hypothetical protein VK850_10450 [Candidatus Binatia bacterium]|nr:hypothetical protein [Candidatus Binatia bacterium]
MRRRTHLILTWLALAGWVACAGCATEPRAAHGSLSDRQIAALNQLRDEINSLYGFRDSTPRINLGPCGRFAKAFREQWNARYPDKLNVVFVMSADGKQCHHVLVRLPNRDYYDGGNGVISKVALLQQYKPGTWLDEMTRFDLHRLDKWSYSLNRDYPLCPNYSDDATLRLINRFLDSLDR